MRHFRRAAGNGAGSSCPAALPGNDAIWNQYTLRVCGAGQRDALRAHLTARGIGSEIYYPIPLHEQECFASLGYQPEELPWAHRLAGEVLSLPIYPELPVAAAGGSLLCHRGVFSIERGGWRRLDAQG